MFLSRDFLWTTDLTNGQVVSIAADHLHLNTIHQTLQLVPDIPGSSHGAELDEVLIAPLCGVTTLHPLRGKKAITTAIRTTPGLYVWISQGCGRLTGHICGTLQVLDPTQGRKKKGFRVCNIFLLNKIVLIFQSVLLRFLPAMLIMLALVFLAQLIMNTHSRFVKDES